MSTEDEDLKEAECAPPDYPEDGDPHNGGID